jgi:tetratricopeptide (TPR) repeat protein
VHWLPSPIPQSSLVVLSELAELLRIRFESHGCQPDLMQSIELHHLVLDQHRSRGGDSHPVLLNNVGIGHSLRFFQLTDEDDIRQALVLHENAIRTSSRDSHDLAASFCGLSLALTMLHRRETDPTQIRRAIGLLRQALSLVSKTDSSFIICTMRLSDALRQLVSYSGGKPDDIRESVALARNALEICPPRHRRRAEILLGLAGKLNVLFEVEDHQELRAEERLLYRQALAIQSTRHPFRPLTLAQLTYRLASGHYFGDSTSVDLNEAIELGEEALSLVTPRHLWYHIFVSSLGYAYSRRSSLSPEHYDDLNKSITLQRQGLKLLHSKVGYRHIHLHNLADALEARYEREKQPEDLEEAIALAREALRHCPPDHHDHPYATYILGRRLLLSPSWSVSQLDEIVACYRVMLENRYVLGHSLRSWAIGNMALIIHARYLRLQDPRDWKESMECFQEAVDDPHTTYVRRFAAVKRWITAAERSNSVDMALRAYQRAIDLIPYHTHLGLDLAGQLESMKKSFATMSCDAAGCALASSQTGEAVRILECSRSIFWAQMLKLRTSFEGLPQQLAHQIVQSAQGIEKYHSQPPSADATGAERIIQQQTLHRKFQELLQQARTYPGFENFLLPYSYDQLAQATARGPVVLLVSSECYGSSAIIIRSPSSGPEHVPLTGITAHARCSMINLLDDTVNQYQPALEVTEKQGPSRLAIRKVRRPLRDEKDLMESLWMHVVQPVISRLGLKVRFCFRFLCGH